MNTSIKLALVLLFVASVNALAQTKVSVPDAARASQAYAEVLLRKTELSAELESLAADYTDESPKIKDLKYEVAALDKAMQRIATVKAGEAGKLTLALGKLLVKRASLDAELNRLSRNYSAEQTEVKRVKKKVEVYDNAIREILP